MISFPSTLTLNPDLNLNPGRRRTGLGFRVRLRNLSFLALIAVLATLCSVASANEITQEERDGQALACELRNATPEENSEIKGVFQIRSSKQKITNNVPLVCKVVVSETHWETIYEIAPTQWDGAEKLIVRHFRDKPNEYLYARTDTRTASLPKLQNVTPQQASIPLAGSDFSLSDLGLEFLHWPQQRRMKGETPLRLGRAYDVLESVNPDAKEIVRVKSFIDKQTGGILAAEAYNAKGKLVKEFTLSGSSFKKVKGVWQLEKMTMENVQKKSRTILRFDLSKD